MFIIISLAQGRVKINFAQISLTFFCYDSGFCLSLVLQTVYYFNRRLLLMEFRFQKVSTGIKNPDKSKGEGEIRTLDEFKLQVYTH